MPKAPSLEEKLARVAALRGKSIAGADADFLRKALSDRSNYFIAKAAEVAGDSAQEDIAPALAEAFTALTDDPQATDKGCMAKTAIAEALVKLHFRDGDFYRKGIKYEQIEPAWGTPEGHVDTAAAVRAACAMGLVECESILDALILFAELLADRWKAARIGAVRAIAALQSQDGIPLLRFKTRIGDKEPEVIGECCTALLELNPEITLPFVVELLAAHDSQICLEAACSLGESRRLEAFEPLRQCWHRQQGSSIGGGLLASIALLRRTEATQFLVSLISDDNETRGEDALKALAPYRFSKELLELVEGAVGSCKSRKLRQLFERKFKRD